jgi:hypothetical protein
LHERAVEVAPDQSIGPNLKNQLLVVRREWPKIEPFGFPGFVSKLQTKIETTTIFPAWPAWFLPYWLGRHKVYVPNFGI